jgi:precorrin-3B synthase
MLVRLRLIGGRVPSRALRSLVEVAEQYGDGRVYLTSRANLQVRAFPGTEGQLAPGALTALEGTGLLPTRTHELVRNLICSPQTGLAGGLMDLRGTAVELDTRLCAAPGLAALPARFLFVFDDGRGDLTERACDLGLVALDDATVQLRVGADWGPVVPVREAVSRICQLAHDFARRRGSGPNAPWHIRELDEPLVAAVAPDPRLPGPARPLRYGSVPGGRHVAVSDAGLDRGDVAALTADVAEVIVTPWRGVLVPEVSHD